MTYRDMTLKETCTQPGSPTTILYLYRYIYIYDIDVLVYQIQSFKLTVDHHHKKKPPFFQIVVEFQGIYYI